MIFRIGNSIYIGNKNQFGQPDGACTVFQVDSATSGRKICGYFVDGKLEGSAVIITPTSQITCQYHNGQKNGKSIAVSFDGYKTISEYKWGSLVSSKRESFNPSLKQAKVFDAKWLSPVTSYVGEVNKNGLPSGWGVVVTCSSKKTPIVLKLSHLKNGCLLEEKFISELYSRDGLYVNNDEQEM